MTDSIVLLGVLFLGTFVGFPLESGLQFPKGPNLKVATAVIGAALGGAPLVFLEGLAAAQRLHDELFDLNQAIFLETNPIPLKYMMARLGVIAGPEVRLPLVPLGEQYRSRLDAVLRRAGLLTPVAS